MRQQSVPVIGEAKPTPDTPVRAVPGPYPADHPADPATRVALRLYYLDDVALVSLNADGGLNVTVIDTASTNPRAACDGLAPDPQSDALEMTVLTAAPSARPLTSHSCQPCLFHRRRHLSEHTVSPLPAVPCDIAANSWSNALDMTVLRIGSSDAIADVLTVLIGSAAVTARTGDLASFLDDAANRSAIRDPAVFADVLAYPWPDFVPFIPCSDPDFPGASADDGGYSDDSDTDVDYDSDYDDMPPLADNYYDDDDDDMPPLVDLSDDDYSHLGYTFVYPLPPTPMNE